MTGADHDEQPATHGQRAGEAFVVQGQASAHGNERIVATHIQVESVTRDHFHLPKARALQIAPRCLGQFALDFDRAHGLRSIPVRFGIRASLVISRALHIVTIICLASLPLFTPLGPAYVAGVLVVAALLAYEQSLVHADDLSQVKRAFDLNGYVGILYLLVLAASIYGR